MNKALILNYLKNINKDDIINFSIKQGIYLDNKDFDIIYDYIKNKSNDIIDNPVKIINEIKDKVSNKVYDKIIILYEKYKPFIDKIK